MITVTQVRFISFSSRFLSVKHGETSVYHGVLYDWNGPLLIGLPPRLTNVFSSQPKFGWVVVFFDSLTTRTFQNNVITLIFNSF